MEIGTPWLIQMILFRPGVPATWEANASNARYVIWTRSSTWRFGGRSPKSLREASSSSGLVSLVHGLPAAPAGGFRSGSGWAGGSGAVIGRKERKKGTGGSTSA